MQAKKQSIEYPTFIGLASTDGMRDSTQHLLTTVLLYWWPNSEAQKTQEYTQTHRLTDSGNANSLKPNSVNAVRLKKDTSSEFFLLLSNRYSKVRLGLVVSV